MNASNKRTRLVRLTLLGAVALIVSALALGQDQARVEQALQQIDPEQIEQILRKNFSPEDIDELARYFQDRLDGRPAHLSRELRRRFEQAMGEVRLEYGFQIAILLSALRKSAKEYGVDLDPLARELDGAD